MAENGNENIIEFEEEMPWLLPASLLNQEACLQEKVFRLFQVHVSRTSHAYFLLFFFLPILIISIDSFSSLVLQEPLIYQKHRQSKRHYYSKSPAAEPLHNSVLVSTLFIYLIFLHMVCRG